MPGYSLPCKYCREIIPPDSSVCPKCGRVNPLEKERCPKCRSLIEHGWVACTHCGLSLRATCPKCGQPTFLGDYCDSCGQRLTITCPKCGTEQPIINEKCIKCKKPIQGGKK